MAYYHQVAISLAEAREQRPARPFLSVFHRGDGRPGEMRKWWAANAPTIALLAIIFLLALFIRGYFGYDIAQDNGYLVSGGSDSYYWQHIIDYSSNTGKQFFFDPLINWPDGIRNPRPPMYSFSVVVPAVFTQGFYASLEDAWGAQLLWSTAFWGALTVVPTYLLGKEAFGRRAGLVAAFFLAVMPAHVQRSVISDADHDAFILFFIVLTFFFVLKAVKTQQHKRWVENWRDFKSVRKGFGDYFRESKTAVLWAAAAGIAYGCVINTWVGFGYVTVLILAYYVIQVLLNKFKNADSTSVTVLIFIVMAVGFLISFPVYYEQALIPVRYDVPVYLWLASMFFGAIFVVTRDYPWTIVLPSVVVMVVALIAVIDVFNPVLAQAILSGEGYFVQNKLYSTIAEARAPVFSELALSFGMVTFFLSLIGMLWAVWKVPKRIAAEYIFMVAWLATAIFMAMSAGRFMFNAAPAFAIAAGWVVVLIIDKLDFGSVRRSLSGASGSYWQIFKKSVKVRHIVGALFLGFMVVLPNVWYGIDAGIPSEIKDSLDKQIYEDLPAALRPSGYDAVNGTSWYLGAFGYSIPLQRYYYPAAWNWFSEQDNMTFPVEKRPAYVAWWDYGFEAMQEGKHPTVADNFQNGYQLTGNVIVSQSEYEAIAEFAYRLIQASYTAGGEKLAAVQSLLEKYNMSVARWNDIINGPAQPIIDKILADPATYGPMVSDLGPTNARITEARVELVALGNDRLISFYSQLCEVTGWEIRYFNVDSRMFPSSATNTGIFYAPAKLADRRISAGSTPTDFFNIVGIDENGVQHDVGNITPSMTIVQYKIIYEDMFYDSMFYRAMVGYSGTDIGQATNDGIPGLSGSGTGTLDSYQAMPGWNLTHFKMVYRTAYFNPYPSGELTGHSADWTAMDLKDVLQLKDEIDKGEIQGTVDTSPAALYTAGTVFLKYYEGALVNGTITTEEGLPVAGVRVTVLDEWGIPHDVGFTNADGHYSVLAPFGEVTLVLSTGDLQGITQTGATTITTMTFNVTDDQAMRRPYDINQDGVYDYFITKDYVMPGTELTGEVFWDVDKDGNYTANTDLPINNTVLHAYDLLSDRNFTVQAPNGTFDAKLPAGQYDFVATVLGRDLAVANKFNVTGQKTATNLPIEPSSMTGHVSTVDGASATGMSVEMLDLQTGVSSVAHTDSNGNFSFPLLLAGQYSMITTEPGLVIFNNQENLSEGAEIARNVTVFPSADITATMGVNGTQAAYASWMLVDNYNRTNIISGVTDQFGNIVLRAPRGLWTLYGFQGTGSALYANAALVDARLGNVTLNLDLKPASVLSGTAQTKLGLVLSGAYVEIAFANGARVQAVTNATGVFTIAVPEGTYTITIDDVPTEGIFAGTVTAVLPSSSMRIKLVDGVTLSGTVWLLKDSTQEPSSGTLGRYADINVTDSSGRTYTTQADGNGAFEVELPEGSTVTVSVAALGYSEWSQHVMITKTTTGFALIAEPDPVTVTGQVTSDGVGIRGVQVVFTPEGVEHEVVYAVTGADGVYSVDVAPTTYTVSVDQETNLAGGEKYLFSQSQIVTPSSLPLTSDIALTTKVEAIGNVLGGATGVKITLSGPEERTLELTGTNYSVLLLPGQYEVYVTGTVSGRQYAEIGVIDITQSTRQNDFTLVRAYSITGTITIPTGTPLKSITVTATAADGTHVGVKSTSSGRYAMSLPPGSYSLSYLLEDTVTQAGHVTFIEYTGTQPVQIVASDTVVDASLSKHLDNTTFGGRVIGPQGRAVHATIELIYHGVYGQNATFTSDPDGEFNVSVQPGDYILYAVSLQEKQAALTTVSFSRNIPRTQDIVLSEARYIAGKVTINGTGIRLPVTLAGTSTTLTLTSDSSGAFLALAPPGNYTLSASTKLTENTLTVTYSASSSFAVTTSDAYAPLPLIRQIVRGVTATWNESLVPSAKTGEKVSFAITVTNTGNVEDDFLVTFTGGGFNVTFTPDKVHLNFGVDDTAIVIAEVYPLSTVAVGQQQAACLVRSLDYATTRATFNLLVDVPAHRGVSLKNVNTSTAVNSLSTVTAFLVNNTGNAGDDFIVSISNKAQLQSLGWSATIIDPATGAETSTVTITAFGSKPLHLKFTALRADADPTALATVFAYSKNATTASAYADVPIILPDLVVGKGDLIVSRGDVSLENDAGVRLVTNVVLLAAFGALILTFYILRRRKGYGGSSKGGAKK